MFNTATVLLKGIKANFSQLMNIEPNSNFDMFINREKSNSDHEKYWIPQSMPGIKEWIDERHFGDFGDKALTVYNKDWDNGIKVDRNTLSDSREYLGGNLESWIKLLVRTYKSFPDKVCQTLLTANSNAFDETAMFATSRPNIDTGSYVLNNLISGTSSTTYTLAEFEADYKSAKTALLGMADKEGEPMNDNPKLVVFVPRHLEDVAKVLLNSRQNEIYVSGSQSNLYAGDAEVVVNFRQTSTSDNDWYLINVNNPFKPFVIQDRKAPNWEVWDDTKKKYIEYGFDFRLGYNFLNPMAIVKVNN